MGNPSAESRGYIRDLQSLTICSAIELDNYILGRLSHFKYVRELSEIIEENKQVNTESLLGIFPFNSFNRVFLDNRNSSEYNSSDYSQLELRLNLLSSSLKSVPSNRKEIIELREFLVDLTNELVSEIRKPY